MACRQCQRCGARWIDGQLYWATGKPGTDLDLAGLVCNTVNDPNCINPCKGLPGGDTWAKRAEQIEAFTEAFEDQCRRSADR